MRYVYNIIFFYQKTISQRYKNRRYSFITYLKSSQFIIVIEKNYKNDIYNNDDIIS